MSNMSIAEGNILGALPSSIANYVTSQEISISLLIMRVVIGFALGLLTVYRREMSCNRVYYSEDEGEDGQCSLSAPQPRGNSRQPANSSGSFDNFDGLEGDSNANPPRLLRHRSSSCLPSLSKDDGVAESNLGGKIQHPQNEKGVDDPTDELLEAAGHFWSGGPLLAVALAVLDHLVLTCFLGSLVFLFGRRRSDGREAVQTSSADGDFDASGIHQWDTQNGGNRFGGDDAVSDCSSPRRSAAASFGESNNERFELEGNPDNPPLKQNSDLRVYNVAWNAAVEYFDTISQKIDDGAEIANAANTNNQDTRNNDVGNADFQKIESGSYPSRSKSTGNLDSLQNVSSEQSRNMLKQMIGDTHRSENMIDADVTQLPADAQILIFSFLPAKDLLSFTCTNRAGLFLLDDGERRGSYKSGVHGNSSAVGGVASICEDTSLLIWKALWKRDFEWILSEWKYGSEAFLRSMESFRGISDTLASGPRLKVMSHLMQSITGSGSIMDSFQTEERNNGTANQADNLHSTPPSSMKEFYFTFAETWINYTIAGCNRSGKCLIGLHGHIFDISNFVESHPGSTETLLLQAGRDATVFFESMGHSLGARSMAMGMVAVINGQCVKWDAGCESLSSANKNDMCRLISPSDSLVLGKKNVHGFLIPRRRSRPRQYGGLSRIRRRLGHEKLDELNKADRWASVTLGPTGLFGGVHVYYDPFCSCWKWWYTDLDFHPIYIESMG